MAFKLKSGNSPLFKKMGATPAKNMKTGSYKHEFENNSKRTPAYKVDDEDEIEGTENLSDKLQVNKTKTLINKGKNALVAGFTSGLDAVYGTGKIQPNSGVVVEEKKGECVEGKNTVTGEPCKEESSDKFSNILNSGNNNNDIKDKPKK